MTNEEQKTLLKRSVYKWNQWRQANPDVLIDLSEVSLSAANLSAANLSEVSLSAANLLGARLSEANLSRSYLGGANLGRVDLSRANLSAASLFRARLSEAYLEGADLNGANLSEANLSAAYLGGADLSGADFSGADLSFARLSGAILTGSMFGDTIFVGIDLSTVLGLEQSIHQGPSTININSVVLPHDEPTRTHFLRGVGFTETQIEYLPSLLTSRPIEYHSLFISYAHQDEALAHRLATDLRKKNVPCWFAPHDLQPGNYYRKHIDQAIHTQDKVVLLLSQHAIESGWVEYEVEVALQREIAQKREILFPLRLDDTIFTATASWACSLKNTRHIGDFTKWQEEQHYQGAFTRLLRQLKTPPKELRETRQK